MNPFTVEGKLALITGATRGIGLGAARALAQSGAGVLLVGRDEAELNRAATELRELTSKKASTTEVATKEASTKQASTGEASTKVGHGFSRGNQPSPTDAALAAEGPATSSPKIEVLPFDLAQTEKIQPWLDEVFAKHGVPDILINSAGMQRRGPAVDLTLEDFNEVMALNTTALFEVSRTFARHHIALGTSGKVINIASLMTSAARPGTSPYTASKGAVGQLTKVLAIEWAKHNIHVNAIAPGYIDTDLNKSLVADPDFDKWVKGRCPLGRWGQPEDIAWPIVFLASHASDFITGQVIYVDGGWLATF